MTGINLIVHTNFFYVGSSALIMTKILVVDDEDDILNLVVDDLTDDGFDVISAENGSALELIYQEQPDVVLCWI